MARAVVVNCILNEVVERVFSVGKASVIGKTGVCIRLSAESGWRKKERKVKQKSAALGFKASRSEGLRRVRLGRFAANQRARPLTKGQGYAHVRMGHTATGLAART